MMWTVVGRLSYILKNPKVLINLKRRVFDTGILPVMTYTMETTTLTFISTKQLRVTQRAVEMIMLGISSRHRITNPEIRRRTKTMDVIARIANLKWNWEGHIARQDETRWAKAILN